MIYTPDFNFYSDNYTQDFLQIYLLLKQLGTINVHVNILQDLYCRYIAQTAHSGVRYFQDFAYWLSTSNAQEALEEINELNSELSLVEESDN